jgi:hypothetical protein
MTDVSMPTGTTVTMPPSEQLMAADDTVVVAWTLWLRALDLRRYAMLARDRAGARRVGLGRNKPQPSAHRSARSAPTFALG